MDDAISQFEVSRSSSTRQQVAHHLREMIRSGKIAAGHKLPTNKELAEKWRVSGSSVHAALSALVKEGLLQRAPKRGTFVADRAGKLTHVGIYLEGNIWLMREASQRRVLVDILCKLFQERGIIAEPWIDSRPVEERKQPWSEMERAVAQRRIQAVVSIECCRPWLERLPVPAVYYTPDPVPNRVFKDLVAGVRLSIEDLIRQGCRSVGMINPASAYLKHLVGVDSEFSQSVRAFPQIASELGLEVRKQWVLHPEIGVVDESESEKYGYDAMQKILSLPERPDGMFITHDWVALGAVMAVLERKVSVPDQLKLVLHRNIEVGLSCPLTVSYLDYCNIEVGRAMLDILDAQLRGEAVSPIIIPPRITPAT